MMGYSHPAWAGAGGEPRSRGWRGDAPTMAATLRAAGGVHWGVLIPLGVAAPECDLEAP